MVYGPSLRVDKWLWFTRLTSSRGAAQELCESRRLRIDGRVIERPSAQVRPGQVLSFPKGEEIMVVRVEALPERRGPYAEMKDAYTSLMRQPLGTC